METATLFGDAVHVLLRPGLGSHEVTEALARADVDVLDVRAVAPSLEDVFLHLVARRRPAAA